MNRNADAAAEPVDPGAASARERTYRYLRQAIMSREIAGGSRLVEERIAESLGVSRTPVREAFQRLGSEGFLIRVRRGHLEVASISDEERNELHMLRVAVDEVVARLLTQKVARVDWNGLYALLEPLSEVHRGGGTHSPAYAMAHLDLHMAINAAAFTERAALAIGGRAGFYATDDYVQQDGHEPIVQHTELLDALASGDEERAVTAALDHAMRGHGGQSPVERPGFTTKQEANQ